MPVAALLMDDMHNLFPHAGCKIYSEGDFKPARLLPGEKTGITLTLHISVTVAAEDKDQKVINVSL